MRWAPRVLIGIVVLVALAVGVGALRVAQFLDAQRTAIRTFDGATSEAKLRGKTPRQIITLLGKPYVDTINDSRNWPHPEHDRVITYQGPWGEMCRVEITDGAATKIEHYGK
jgi:hypothetical protein